MTDEKLRENRGLPLLGKGRSYHTDLWQGSARNGNLWARPANATVLRRTNDRKMARGYTDDRKITCYEIRDSFLSHLPVVCVPTAHIPVNSRKSPHISFVVCATLALAGTGEEHRPGPRNALWRARARNRIVKEQVYCENLQDGLAQERAGNVRWRRTIRVPDGPRNESRSKWDDRSPLPPFSAVFSCGWCNEIPPQDGAAEFKTPQKPGVAALWSTCCIPCDWLRAVPFWSVPFLGRVLARRTRHAPLQRLIMGQMVPKSQFQRQFLYIFNIDGYVAITMRSMSPPEITAKTGLSAPTAITIHPRQGDPHFGSFLDSVAHSRRANWLTVRPPPTSIDSPRPNGTAFSAEYIVSMRSPRRYSLLPFRLPPFLPAPRDNFSLPNNTQEQAMLYGRAWRRGLRLFRNTFACNDSRKTGISRSVISGKTEKFPSRRWHTGVVVSVKGRSTTDRRCAGAPQRWFGDRLPAGGQGSDLSGPRRPAHKASWMSSLGE